MIRSLTGAVSRNRRLIGWTVAAAAVLGWLMLYRLGSLTGGLSREEMQAAAAPLGWHGIFTDPLYLPLKLARSVVFFFSPGHGQTLTRLPDAIFGALAVISFTVLVRLWYGARIAALAGVMFATAAWTLHVSRLAGFDAIYLWALPSLMAAHFLLRKYYDNFLVWSGSLVAWGLLLYLPGMIWFVMIELWLQRRFIIRGWREAGGWWRRPAYVLLGLVCLPLITIHLSRQGHLAAWLGLPQHLDTATEIAKGFMAVPAHLFIRGPEYPQLWLGRAPVMDVFALAMCLLGIYFYAGHWKSARTRYLGLLALMGFILVGLGGPVPLSLLVPLLYVSAATGLAYMLSQWLRTFPNNPLARGVGLGLIILAVALSCLYNYRAYFIAWPHAAATKAVFQYRRHP